MKTEQATKPQKLFAITIAVYALLTILILAACFLVEYPTTYNIKFLKGQTIGHHLKIDFTVNGAARLEQDDHVILKDKLGRRYKASITNVTQERDKLTVTVLINADNEISVIVKNRIVELTKHQKLFVILVNKLN